MANNSAHDFGIVAMRLGTQRHKTISSGYRFFAVPTRQIDALVAAWSSPACHSGIPEIKPVMDSTNMRVRGQSIPSLFLGFGPTSPHGAPNVDDGDVTFRAWSSVIEKIQPRREIHVQCERQDFFAILYILDDMNHPKQGFRSFWRHLENTPAFISMLQPAFDALAIDTSCSAEPKPRSQKRSI